MSVRRLRLCGALLAASIGLAAGLAMAHSGATGVVKERMELMKAVGAAMKSLTETMRGERPYDSERIRADAAEIARHGGEAMTTLFPEGSLEKPTEAKPEIWQDWERFSALSDQLKQIAEALQQAADNPRMGSDAGAMGGGMMQGGGMMRGGLAVDPAQLADKPPEAAYTHLAQTCTACHEGFRVKR